MGWKDRLWMLSLLLHFLVCNLSVVFYKVLKDCCNVVLDELGVLIDKWCNKLVFNYVLDKSF